MPAIILVTLILLLIVYLCLAFLPYTRQAGVSSETQDSFCMSDYMSDAECGERALVIADNERALAERIRLISHARENLILSTFDMRPDHSGNLILASMLEAADRGVTVQIIVDAYSYMTQVSGSPYFQALANHENARIKVYNPIHILKPWKFMARLHDKYLIADDTAYILGGRNTNDLFLGKTGENTNYDWDVLISLAGAYEGSSLAQVEQYFHRIWDLKDSRIIMGKKKDTPKVSEAITALHSLLAEAKESHADWFEAVDYNAITVPANRITLLSNPIYAKIKEPVLFYQMTELMKRSGQAVTFHTPYILCSRYMMERLSEICAASPKVTMMTNSVANNANPFGASDFALHKEEILATGVRILEYDQGLSYHGKCFTLEKRLCGIGSFNWDMRSAYLDTELMLFFDSEPVTAMLREEMAKYETKALSEGQTGREINPGKRRALRILKPLNKPFRFIM